MAKVNLLFKKKYLKIGVIAFLVTVLTAFYPQNHEGAVVFYPAVSNGEKNVFSPADSQGRIEQGMKYYKFGFPLVVRDGTKLNGITDYDFSALNFLFNFAIWFGSITILIYLYEFDKFEIQLKRKEINKKGE